MKNQFFSSSFNKHLLSTFHVPDKCYMLSLRNLMLDLKDTLGWMGPWGKALLRCNFKWRWVGGQGSLRTGVCVLSDVSQTPHAQVFLFRGFSSSYPAELLTLHEIRLPRESGLILPFSGRHAAGSQHIPGHPLPCPPSGPVLTPLYISKAQSIPYPFQLCPVCLPGVLEGKTSLISRMFLIHL